MKVIILAGGLGTRLAEETDLIPKPMVEVGGRPILWHIMKHYASFGLTEFIVALGYKGEIVKRYFLDYPMLSSSFCIRTRTGEIWRQDGPSDEWTVHLVDTGADTMTGGRIRRVRDIIGNQTFAMTYGDGVSNVNITKLLDFHQNHGKLATITAVRPPARFGGINFDGDRVASFTEKPQVGEGWINGGFFVLEPKVIDYIEGDSTFFEIEPLERLTADGQLMAFRHADFWQCMDTLRDRRLLERLWANNEAPWKTW